MLKINALKLAAILFFVVSIIYMAQTPQGFGHTATLHPPNFYVNSNGDSTDVHRTDEAGNKFDESGNKLNDPRIDYDYSDSTGSKIHNASSWARRYYASNVISANHAYDDESELIIGAKLELSVSAGCTTVSGSVSPTLTDDGGITTGWTWYGKGSLTLRITRNANAHRIIRPLLSPFYYCHVVEVEKSNLATGDKNIKIKIVDGSELETEGEELSLELSEGPAKVSAKWSRSKTKVMKDIYAKTTGINASLNCSFSDNHFGVSRQLDKSAEVTGNLGSATNPDDVSTWYNRAAHNCNGGVGSGSPF